MALFGFGEIEELEEFEGKHKTFNFVLEPHTFEFALETALNHAKKEELILVMTSSSLMDLKTMFNIVKKEDLYEITTKFGSFLIDIEEELVEQSVLFQKNVRTINEGEEEIRQTIPVVILNYCLRDDESANIINVEKMAEKQKWLEENPEIKQAFNQVLEKSLAEIFGIGKPLVLSDISEVLKPWDNQKK